VEELVEMFEMRNRKVK